MGQLAEFATSHPLLALSVIASLFGVMFYELRLRGQSLTHVSAGDAVRLINKGATIIDVRKPDEYRAGHIVNARNIDLSKIEADESALKKPKNKVLLAVCENGFNSAKAATLLRKAGHENVFSLKAGLAGWRAENMPLVK